MNKYKSIATGIIYEVIREANDYLTRNTDFRIHLKKADGSFYDIFVTPSDLALGFTKVEEVATPSDSLVGKKFRSRLGEDVVVKFDNGRQVIYRGLETLPSYTYSRTYFLAAFTEVTGE